MESAVFDYIEKHEGELDIGKCAKKLNVTEKDVESAAKRLVKKGKLEEPT